jgi:hypothetical protein
MCALFGGIRDVSLVKKLNRELLGNIITQQAAFYKFKLGETKINIYGESAGEKYYDGPFLFNCLIEREDQEYASGEDGVNYQQGISFSFFRDDLIEASILPEVGDIILYQEGYYEVSSTVSNQYFVGKNPSYPNNNSNGTPNPLNPELEKFGSNISITCKTYYIPSDKVAISPTRERF